MGFMGWDYYRGPSPAAAGVGSFAQGFMDAYGKTKGLSQRDEALAEEKRQADMIQQLRKEQMRHLAQQTATQEYALNKEKELQSGLMGLRNQANLAREYPMVARPAPTRQDYIDLLTTYNPTAAIPLQIQQENLEIHKPLIAAQTKAQEAIPGLYAAHGRAYEAAAGKTPLNEKEVYENAHHFTPESVQEFVKGGMKDFSVLKPATKANEKTLDNFVELELASRVPGFLTDPAIRDKAYQRMALDPTFAKEVKDAANLTAKARAPEMYQFPATDKGIIPVSGRTGEVKPGSQPIGNKPTPESEIKAGKELGTLLDTVGQIKSLYSSDFVGPVAGRAYQLGQKFVNLPEKQVKFYSYVNDAKDALLRARSGAQINEQEYQRLVGFLPDANLPEKNFEARVKRFEEQLNIIAKNREREMKGGGYSPPAAPGTGNANVAPEAPKKTIVKTGTLNGRKVFKYSDGTTEYGN